MWKFLIIFGLLLVTFVLLIFLGVSVFYFSNRDLTGRLGSVVDRSKTEQAIYDFIIKRWREPDDTGRIDDRNSDLQLSEVKDRGLLDGSAAPPRSGVFTIPYREGARVWTATAEWKRLENRYRKNWMFLIDKNGNVYEGLLGGSWEEFVEEPKKKVKK